MYTPLEELIKIIKENNVSGETDVVEKAYSYAVLKHDGQLRKSGEEYVNHPISVAKIIANDYYLKMMIAWYFATALAMQWNSIIPYFEDKKLPVWIQNKAIQKAIESRRITADKKAYLKSLKIKVKGRG